MVHHDRETIRWVERILDTRVASSKVLLGGMSSVVRHITLTNGSSIVVRHIADRERLERDPDLIGREARALELLAESEVPAPRLVASEPSQGRLAMSMLPGTVLHEPSQLQSRTAALADLAATVARVELPDDHGLQTWRSWAPPDLTPPSWGDAGLWAECISAYNTEQAPATEKLVLLHRDFHPLNVLWSGSRVAGLVDWVDVCVGHPHAELSHCRWNLTVLVNITAADDFLDRYLEQTGSGPFSQWWDLATVLGLLPGPVGTSGWNEVGRDDLTPEVARTATEVFIRAALNAR